MQQPTFDTALFISSSKKSEEKLKEKKKNRTDQYREILLVCILIVWVGSWHQKDNIKKVQGNQYPPSKLNVGYRIQSTSGCRIAFQKESGTSGEKLCALFEEIVIDFVKYITLSNKMKL